MKTFRNYAFIRVIKFLLHLIKIKKSNSKFIPLFSLQNNKFANIKFIFIKSACFTKALINIQQYLAHLLKLNRVLIQPLVVLHTPFLVHYSWFHAGLLSRILEPEVYNKSKRVLDNKSWTLLHGQGGVDLKVCNKNYLQIAFGPTCIYSALARPDSCRVIHVPKMNEPKEKMNPVRFFYSIFLILKDQE